MHKTLLSTSAISSLQHATRNWRSGKLRNLWTNHRHSAFFIPHFTYRIPHSAFYQQPFKIVVSVKDKVTDYTRRLI